jgi:hypothetical protein
MSSVQNDVRERFNQFLADTNEEIVFAPSNAISPQHSEFFVYVCEVVDGGADVFRYYGKNFIFDRFIRDQAIGNELPEECGTRRLDTIDNDDLASESSAPVDVQLSDSGGNMKYNNIIYLSAAKAVNDEGFYTIDSYGEMPFILLTNFDSGEFARVVLDEKDYIISVAETDDFYALIDEYARTESVNIFEKAKESDPGDLNYAFISSLIDGDFDDFEYENKPFKVKQFDLNSVISSNKIKNNSIGFWILQMQIEECEIGLDKCSVTLNGETYKTGGDIFNALYGNSDIRACFLR